MAGGRGMGAATKGGGAVESGPENKMVSETSQKTGPAMVAKGGMMSKKMMAGGMMNRNPMMPGGMKEGGMAKKMMAGGGMMKKGYAAGGAVKKKMMAGGGAVRGK
jgi:hypothetical protein